MLLFTFFGKSCTILLDTTHKSWSVWSVYEKSKKSLAKNNNDSIQPIGMQLLACFWLSGSPCFQSCYGNRLQVHYSGMCLDIGAAPNFTSNSARCFAKCLNIFLGLCLPLPVQYVKSLVFYECIRQTSPSSLTCQIYLHLHFVYLSFHWIMLEHVKPLEIIVVV